MKRWLRLAAFALVSGVFPNVAGAEDKGPPTPKARTFRNGLVLLDDKVAYSVNPQGGISAVDLTTGKVLWSATPELPPKGKNTLEPELLAKLVCYWPLAVHDNQLLVRRRNTDKPNVITIVSLDLTQKGKVVKESDPIEFPAGVVPKWNDPTSRSIGGAPPAPIPEPPIFHTESAVENGKLMIAWEWTAPLVPATPNTEKRGRFEVDLARGGVRALPADKKAPAAQSTEFVVGDLKLAVVDHDPKAGPPKKDEPPVAVKTTTIVPTLRATDSKTGKVVWEYALRGSSTTTINFLAP